MKISALVLGCAVGTLPVAAPTRFPLYAAVWAFTCATRSPQTLSSQPAVAGPDFDRIRRLIAEELDPSPVPSIAVAVVHRGEIVWEDAFGWANREQRVAATVNTPYYWVDLRKAAER